MSHATRPVRPVSALIGTFVAVAVTAGLAGPYGFDTASSVVKGWMNSPGHKRNILDCKFNKIGIGFSADGKYWVQDFGY
jgi:uncharacterized protein YkwD